MSRITARNNPDWKEIYEEDDKRREEGRESMNKLSYLVEHRQKGNPYGLTIRTVTIKADSFEEALHKAFVQTDKLKKPLTWKRITSVETGENFTLEEFRKDLTLQLPNDR